jgi:Anti-sigma factor NepR
MTEKRRSRTKVPEDPIKVTPQNMTQSKLDFPHVAMQDLLGDKLRAYYNEVAKEPVPDRFDQLLKELEARSSPKKND